jgi:hypothetical protein
MLWDQYFSESKRRLTVVSDNHLYWLPIKVHFAIAVLLNYYKLVRFWLDRLHSSV